MQFEFKKKDIFVLKLYSSVNVRQRLKLICNLNYINYVDCLSAFNLTNKWCDDEIKLDQSFHSATKFVP